ncbi:MAG TPA: glycosyltransferase family 39 protein, partial [Candidatus Tumulicola sp.]
MDVQASELTAAGAVETAARTWWWVALGAIVFAGLLLRLHGIGHPILDHPGWRQGDTASIARNFAQLRFNIAYPQTTYNGPPPNYVELELQIVPFVSAMLYKAIGVHEWIGRAIVVLFSLATIATLAYFGRWLFSSAIAGLSAAAVYAVFPGSVYYGRTFMPDAAMVFFLTAALYATTVALCDERRFTLRGSIAPALLLTFAYLAKPVAVVAIVPVCLLIALRYRERRPTNAIAVAIVTIVPLAVLWGYDRIVSSHAEWHWASGITSLHVVPSLRAALTGGRAFVAKVSAFWTALGLVRATMFGTAGFGLTLLGFVAIPWAKPKSRALLRSWLAAEIAY